MEEKVLAVRKHIPGFYPRIVAVFSAAEKQEADAMTGQLNSKHFGYQTNEIAKSECGNFTSDDNMQWCVVRGHAVLTKYRTLHEAESDMVNHNLRNHDLEECFVCFEAELDDT